MKIICIIPARGGSKRIPRKNIRQFCGKPIIAYSIEVALKCGLFDEVMVSTDDEEIAAIARQYGANVPFLRSAETANDYATTDDVLKEVLAEYEKRGETFDVMCCIYPCAPLITVKRLRQCLEKLNDSPAEVVFPMVQFPSAPQRGFTYKDGLLVRVQPELTYVRTQDIPKVYYDPGQFYFFDIPAFHAKSGIDRIYEMVEVSSFEVQDVDSPEDWKLAELKYELIHNGEFV